MSKILFWFKVNVLWPLAYRFRKLFKPGTLPKFETEYTFEKAKNYWKNVPRAAGANPLNTIQLKEISDADLEKLFDDEMQKANSKEERKVGFQVALDLLKQSSSKNVLEYGSGFGFYGIKILTTFPDASVSFADINENNLEVIRRIAKIKGFAERAECCLVEDPDASGLKFDRPFDAMISMGVLHHTPNAPTIVHNITQFLKENGFFEVLLYNHEFHRSMSLCAGEKLSEGGFGALTDPVAEGLSNPYSIPYNDDEAKQLFCDYELIRSEYPMPFYNIYVFKKNG